MPSCRSAYLVKYRDNFIFFFTLNDIKSDTVIFIEYYQSDEMRKDNKGGICSMHITHEKGV
jgi:hypothetical protein